MKEGRKKLETLFMRNWPAILTADFVFLLFSSCSYEHGGRLEKIFACAVGLVCCTVLFVGIRKKSRGLLYAAALLFYFGAVMLGNWLLAEGVQISYSSAVLLCNAAIIAFLFALLEEPENSAAGMRQILTAASGVTAGCLVLTLAGVAAGRSLSFFHGTFVFGAAYSAKGVLSLSMLGLDGNAVGALAFCLFFVALYLRRSGSGTKERSAFAVCEVIFAAGAVLSAAEGIRSSGLRSIMESLKYAFAVGSPLHFLLLLMAGFTIKAAGESSSDRCRKPARILSVCVFLIPALLLAHSAAAPKDSQPSEIPPEISYTEDLLIRVAPGVSEEMLSADVWQTAEGDAVIMTTEEILQWNEENKRMIGTNAGAVALKEFPEILEGSAAKVLVSAVEIPDNPQAYTVNGKPTDAAYWNSLLENANIDGIPSAVSVRFGYSVVRSTLRQLPSRDTAVLGKDLLFDKLIRSDYPPFVPLAVIHESADGAWYYIVMYGYAGWIEKESVALCETREEWLAWQNEEDFLVVTGSELRLADEPYQEGISDMLLPMGTKLPLADPAEVPTSVNARSGYGCYTVKLPVRDKNGMLQAAYCFVPQTADVHRGYLTYTANNLISQAFKCLGDRYGWAGDFNAFDCSGYTHAVYSCFGLELPRTSAAQVRVKDGVYGSFSGMSQQTRLETLRALPAGTLLYFNGHIMLYLGFAGEDPCVISSVSSLCLWNEDAGRITAPLEVNTVSVNSLTQTYRASGYSWLNALSDYVVIK